MASYPCYLLPSSYFVISLRPSESALYYVLYIIYFFVLAAGERNGNNLYCIQRLIQFSESNLFNKQRLAIPMYFH